MQWGQCTRDGKPHRFASSWRVDLDLEFRQFIEDNIGIVRSFGEYHKSVAMEKRRPFGARRPLKALTSFRDWITSNGQGIRTMTTD